MALVTYDVYLDLAAAAIAWSYAPYLRSVKYFFSLW
jgi:hypothetical protein